MFPQIPAHREELASGLRCCIIGVCLPKASGVLLGKTYNWKNVKHLFTVEKIVYL